MLYNEIVALGQRIYENPNVIMAMCLGSSLIYVEDRKTKGECECEGSQLPKSPLGRIDQLGVIYTESDKLPDGVERYEVHIDTRKSKRASYVYSGMKYSKLFNHMIQIKIYCNASYYKKVCAASPQDVSNFSHCLSFILLDCEPSRDNLTVLDVLSPIVRFCAFENTRYMESKKYVEGYNLTDINLTDRVLLHNMINSRCLLNYELAAPEKENLTVQELYSSVNHYITNDKFIYDFSSYDRDILIEKIENLKENRIKIDLMNYNVANISIDIHEASYEEDMGLLRYIYENADSFIYATKLCFGINCVDIKKQEIYDSLFDKLGKLEVKPLDFQNADLLVNFTQNIHLSNYLSDKEEWSKENNPLVTEKVGYISNAKTLVVKTGLHRLRDYFETIYFSNLLISNVKLTYDTQNAPDFTNK